MPAGARKTMPPHRPAHRFWTSQLVAGDAVGRLMAFWGFKRNMGRIWTALYLNEEALTARQLREGLGISVGSVSMTLGELEEWGVVSRVRIRGSRSWHFEAETDLWKMITRVLDERERAEIVAARAAFREAMDHVVEQLRSPDPGVRRRARVQRRRLSKLLDLTRLGTRLLEALVATGRVDMSPLARSLLRRRRR